MAESVRRVYYRSDFDFIAKLMVADAGGEDSELGFPAYDWRLFLKRTRGAPFMASSIGGVLTNCVNDGGRIRIICKNHDFVPGHLTGEMCCYIPNQIYPEGVQTVVFPQEIGIELVDDAGDEPTDIEIQLALPFIYDSAYRQAVSAGYKGTQEDYMALASQLPNAVETANKVQASADSLADSAETIGGAIDTLTSTTDAIELGANVIKDNADALQKSAVKVGESVAAVEQAVEPLVQASESLNATKHAFEMLSSEWADGRRAIATALTNRRYPTEPSESFHAMADKITNMSYEEGWFAKIGYTDENDGGIQDAIDYAYELAKAWNPDGSTIHIFRQSPIYFLPNIDVSQIKDATSFLSDNKNVVFVPYLNFISCKNFTRTFQACSNLRIVKMYTSEAENIEYCFYNCSGVVEIYLSDTGKATNLQGLLGGCTKVERIYGLNLASAKNIGYTFGNNLSALVLMTIKNIGKSSLTTFDISGVLNWGTGGEENRQSLIDSLITYSYDRASNGMATATIKLSANTKALLTEEEIAQITAKGFTIA